MLARRHVNFPLIARRVGQLKVRMVAYAHRHGLAGLIFQQGFHFERAAGQPVRHLDRVRKRKLRHEIGVTPEFQAAGDPRRFSVSLELGHRPVGRKK